MPEASAEPMALIAWIGPRGWPVGIQYVPLRQARRYERLGWAVLIDPATEPPPGARPAEEAS